MASGIESLTGQDVLAADIFVGGTATESDGAYQFAGTNTDPLMPSSPYYYAPNEIEAIDILSVNSSSGTVLGLVGEVFYTFEETFQYIGIASDGKSFLLQDTGDDLGPYNSYFLFAPGGIPASYTNSYYPTGYTFTACYVAGTHIATTAGELPIEALTINHHVVTHSGRHRRVRWIGRRSYAGRFLAANPQLQPIRFSIGSLGIGLPRRELLVSPDHAMLLEGRLIPARYLVNGSTIMQDRGRSHVDYLHVELDSHDILLAEGAAAESFLDDDSRGIFQNAVDTPSYETDDPRPAAFCAPRLEDGYELEMIRQRLAAIPTSKAA